MDIRWRAFCGKRLVMSARAKPHRVADTQHAQRFPLLPFASEHIGGTQRNLRLTAAALSAAARFGVAPSAGDGWRALSLSWQPANSRHVSAVLQQRQRMRSE